MDFYYLQLGLHKGYNPYTRGEHKAKIQSPNAQSKSLLYKREDTKQKRMVTTLGDHKDHKQHLSQYRIQKIDFAMDSSSLRENKDFKSEHKRKHLGKLLEWYRKFDLKLEILKT